ncbi:Uncharacterised protein r2_g344 [Pycnogonum litorale]
MTIGEDRNKDRFENGEQEFCWISENCVSNRLLILFLNLNLSLRSLNIIKVETFGRSIFRKSVIDSTFLKLSVIFVKYISKKCQSFFALDSSQRLKYFLWSLIRQCLHTVARCKKF